VPHIAVFPLKGLGGFGVLADVAHDLQPGALATAPARVNGSVSVTSSGVNVPISYAGISPGGADLYQINLTVLAGASRLGISRSPWSSTEFHRLRAHIWRFSSCPKQDATASNPRTRFFFRGSRQEVSVSQGEIVNHDEMLDLVVVYLLVETLDAV
jgi:hypothetical protein